MSTVLLIIGIRVTVTGSGKKGQIIKSFGANNMFGSQEVPVADDRDVTPGPASQEEQEFNRMFLGNPIINNQVQSSTAIGQYFLA